MFTRNTTTGQKIQGYTTQGAPAGTKRTATDQIWEFESLSQLPASSEASAYLAGRLCQPSFQHANIDRGSVLESRVILVKPHFHTRRILVQPYSHPWLSAVTETWSPPGRPALQLAWFGLPFSGAQSPPPPFQLVVKTDGHLESNTSRLLLTSATAW